jgi:hypothetical protein
MSWKTWDVYVDSERRGTTGGATREDARELAAIRLDVPKDKIVLVPKGKAGRR